MRLEPESALRLAGSIPARAGIGLRAPHYAAAANSGAVRWFEVHPENYMCAGGPHHRYLTMLRHERPLSFHGVGLSLGGMARPDQAHLARLKDLMGRYEPALFSEHLSWSTHDGLFFNDLLPLSYTSETLRRLVSHVMEVQDFLGRQILVENPSLYVTFAENAMGEPDLLRELVRQSGCGLLLDVNNVFVSAVNCGFDPYRYLAGFPLEAVQEIHLAGHVVETDSDGNDILIDTHSTAIAEPVWNLFSHVAKRTGTLPTLIEWDQDLPSYAELVGVAEMANKILADGESRAA